MAIRIGHKQLTRIILDSIPNELIEEIYVNKILPIDKRSIEEILEDERIYCDRCLYSSEDERRFTYNKDETICSDCITDEDCNTDKL